MDNSLFTFAGRISNFLIITIVARDRFNSDYIFFSCGDSEMLAFEKDNLNNDSKNDRLTVNKRGNAHENSLFWSFWSISIYIQIIRRIKGRNPLRIKAIIGTLADR